MKYFIAVLAILLLISSSFERRISRINRKYRSYHNRNLGPAAVDSPVYQFIVGMVKEIASNDRFNNLIQSCSHAIGADTVANTEPDPNEQSMITDNSVTSNFVGVVTKVIDFCCNFKDNIVNAVSQTWSKYLRLFMQGKIKKRFTKWGFTGLWSKIKDTAEKVKSSVISHAQKIGSAINHAKEWLDAEIKEFTNKMEEYVSKKFEPILQAITSWFEKKFQEFLEKHPTLKKLYEFGVCFVKALLTEKELVDAAKKISSIFSGVIMNISKIFTGSGIVSLIINAVCGWRLIVRGFDYLEDAKKDKNKLNKAAYRGAATADFLMVIAGDSDLGGDPKNHDKNGMPPRMKFAS